MSTLIRCLLIAIPVALLSSTHSHANVPEMPEGTMLSARNVPIEPGARRELVVEGLEHPWGLAFLPNGGALVTERPGRLRVIEKGVLRKEPITGVPAVFAQNQGGLLDVIVHPRFNENQLIYLSYAHGTAEANTTRVARARFTGAALEDFKVIYESNTPKPGTAHFGSRLAWMPDGTLLISMGDGGNPPLMLNGKFTREKAQDKTSHLGKLVRVHDDGTLPDDNPFVKDKNAAPGVWSMGHRNIQGLAVDTARNTVWATEHGSLGGDELNRVRAGGNYGWPLISLTREYTSGKAVGEVTTRKGMIDPVLLWDVSVAPSGLLVYSGNTFPQWEGDLFSGSLVSLDVRRLDLNESGAIINETALRVGQRVRDVEVGPDGFLYVLTDEKAGRVMRFVPASASNTPAAPQAIERKTSN
jgi:aldose sugar dehydrogenase